MFLLHVRRLQERRENNLNLKAYDFLCVELLCALKRKTGKVLGLCSFEEARKMLVLLEVINDKALLLLLDDSTSRNP